MESFQAELFFWCSEEPGAECSGATREIPRPAGKSAGLRDDAHARHKT
jgi:hypothetical protein